MTTSTDAYEVSTIPLKPRLIKSLALAIPAIGLSVWAWIEQANNGVLLSNFWFPLIFFGAGCYFSWKTLITTEKKELTGTWIAPPVKKGLWKRVAIAIVITIYVGIFLQASIGDAKNTLLSTRILPLIPLVFLTGLYIWREFKPAKEFVPSSAAKDEMARLEIENADKALVAKAKEDELYDKWWFRYLSASFMVGGAIWLSEYKPKLWFVSVILVILAILSARELIFLILGVGAIWLLVAGIASLPVSLAVIIGAIIIASALKR